jgi:hypothetical protein
MRTLLVSALALGAFTSAAFAEPLVLSDVQMDGITAGQDVNQSNSSEINVTSSQSNSNTGPNEGDVNQSNSSTVTVSVGQSNTNSPPPAP